MPNPEIEQFIERMGLAVERLSLPRTFGRLFGLLMVADRPLSLAEIADQLQVSKASVSTNARLCEQVGLARRVSTRGDRRDFYDIAPGSFEHMTRHRVESFHVMAGLAAEGLASIGDEPSPARARLEEMLGFYMFMGEEVEALLERWREMKG
jgi:DNA-binding MarR family transcriptional regulator